MPSAPANRDPALSHSLSGSATNALSSTVSGPSNNIGDLPGEVPGQLGQGFGSDQIMSLLRHIPVFNKLNEQGNLKEDAAQTLSNLSQATFAVQHQLPMQQHPYPGIHHAQHPAISDPGPSSHPRGPPNLGQLSAVAAAGAQPSAQMSSRMQGQEMEETGSDADDGGNQSAPGGNSGTAPQTTPSGAGGRTRGSRSATMGSDEWSRQRKDNHKEVERRRRGNINEGINELGRIVPNGSGEKAKGAILSRAVQYIHHLKENEARNIEKWTLEKLLMDQALTDAQAQLEQVKKHWEDERMARQRAENELGVLRSIHSGRANGTGHGYGSRSRSPDANMESGMKRRGGDPQMDIGGGMEDTGDGESRTGKRQRVEEKREL